MKKRTLSALLLAGVMAATMVPTAVFAATTQSQKTTVGYTAGGNTSTDGRIMVTVPKDVDFTDSAKSVSGFNVEAKVWNASTGAYVSPDDTNTLGKSITVSVASTNGYKLFDTTKNEAKAGKYTYTLNKLANGGNGSLVLDGTTGKGEATKAVEIGTLKDNTAQQPQPNNSRYTIEGTLNMTKTPTPGKTEKGTFFSDVLTYTFGGLTN